MKALRQLKKLELPRHRSKSRGRYDRTSWRVQPAVQGNGALTNAIKAASDNGNLEHVSWVGTLGFPTDQMGEDRRREIDEKLENEYDALPVWTKDADFDGHYTHFCHTILWPIFHYQVPDHPKSKAFEDHSWKYYVKVNEAFAERIIESYKHGDTIWIHDYHLLLVPELIRRKLPEARIGFFLHTAFPSSEVFRCLATRTQLLHGMLGANLIVFQTPEYSHHFLTTCGRLLVVEATEDGVQLEDHLVNVTSVPMGIVPDQLQAARQDSEVKQWIGRLSEKYKDKRVIVSRDKIDHIRGVRQKFLAFELFLQHNPHMVEDVVLIQVATSSETDKDVDAAIMEVQMRIDAQFSSLSHQPLVFFKQDIPHSQFLALLSFADICMLTPLRDGMNLTGHEFIACQDGRGTANTAASEKMHGPLILSEFTGSAAVIDGAVKVNPWDYRQCSRAIKRSLEMGNARRDKRYELAVNSIKEQNGERWVEQLRLRLNAAVKGHHSRGVMNVPRLSTNTLVQQYKDSENRLFILDYEGTLAAWDPSDHGILLNPQRAIDVMINLMASSDRNIVYVNSGRTTSELEHIFAQVPGIGLIAENGASIRPFTTQYSTMKWRDLASHKECESWKPGVMNILKYYHERLEDSWIEERHFGVIFHYDRAIETDIGYEGATRQAGECATQINDSCRSSHVRAVPIDNTVVIELMDHNKMTAASWVLEYESNRLGGIPELSDLATRRESLADSAVDRGSPPENKLDSVGSIKPIHISTDRTKDAESITPPHGARVESPTSNYFPEEPIISPSVTSEPDPRAVMPDFMMVCGDSRDDERLFRWANEKSDEEVIKNVISLYVGSKPTTEATTTLTQGVVGKYLLCRSDSRQ